MMTAKQVFRFINRHLDRADRWLLSRFFGKQKALKYIGLYPWGVVYLLYKIWPLYTFLVALPVLLRWGYMLLKLRKMPMKRLENRV